MGALTSRQTQNFGRKKKDTLNAAKNDNFSDLVQKELEETTVKVAYKEPQEPRKKVRHEKEKEGH